MQKGKKFVTFAIHVCTMWYEEKVSNFEIAVAKLKETLQKFVALKDFYYDHNTNPFTVISHLL